MITKESKKEEWKGNLERYKKEKSKIETREIEK